MKRNTSASFTAAGPPFLSFSFLCFFLFFSLRCRILEEKNLQVYNWDYSRSRHDPSWPGIVIFSRLGVLVGGRRDRGVPFLEIYRLGAPVDGVERRECLPI